MCKCKPAFTATAALSPAEPSGLCLHLRKVRRSLLNIGGKVRELLDLTDLLDHFVGRTGASGAMPIRQPLPSTSPESSSKPPTTSFASVKGPSITFGFPALE